MGKVTIYGKKSAVAVEVINNVEEHYCTNGMFYVRAEDQEYYFALEAISVIRVETESEDKKRGKWISIDATHSKCEKCEAIFEITSPNAEVNFCPSCGVLLESEMQI